MDRSRKGGPANAPDPRHPARPRPKRASKRSMRLAAAGGAAVAFALPWAVLRAVPTPPAPPARVIVVSGGSVAPGTGRVHGAQAPGRAVTTTRASGAPPPGA